MPPPSWAYPYATMWEDFETSGVLATSTSGGSYSVGTGGVLLHGGLSGGGRTGVGSCDPSTLVNSFAQVTVPVPSAGSEGVYVKFEIYAEDAHSFYDVYLQDTADLTFPVNQFDFGWVGNASVALGNTPYAVYSGSSGYDEYDLITFPDWLDSSWHTFEWQLLSGTVTVLMDGVAIGTSALLNPGLGALYAGVDIHFSTTFGERVWLDNFEAGPWDGGGSSGPTGSADDLASLSDDYLAVLVAVTPPILGRAVLRSPSLSFRSP